MPSWRNPDSRSPKSSSTWRPSLEPKFCLGAKTDNEMAFSVMRVRRRGRRHCGSRDVFKALALVPNREIFVNKKTMLTVRQPPTKTPASEAATKKAAQVFTAM